LLVVSLLVVVPVALVWLADGLLSFSIGDFKFLGLIPVALGMVFLLNLFMYFALAGGGTIAPVDPLKRLVTQGLFRYIRNSGYIGGLLIIAGEGFFLESAVIFVFTALVWVMFHLYICYYEEPRRKEMFGESYKKYMKTVPRWIPRRPRKT
jgi:protein-S-isoprenylcysteine O-methyltransferase Ste14